VILIQAGQEEDIVVQDNGSRPPSINEHEFEAIAGFLGESPQTVISLHMLEHGVCEVICVGSPHAPEGVVIQSTEYPQEPIAYGDAEAIASILHGLAGWTCLNVPADLAGALEEDVRRAANASSVRMLDDVYHILETPSPEFNMPDVRLMTRADADLFRSAPDELDGADDAWLLRNLEHGYVGGAIRNGQIVSLAHTFATSKVYADLGVRTMTDWRRKGLATAAASIVARAIQRDGRTPVWSCGNVNVASLAVAARLGFREVSRRVYLIPVMDPDLAIQESGGLEPFDIGNDRGGAEAPR
jgi:RimJ/RimL family protein N-acetyltransferase